MKISTINNQIFEAQKFRLPVKEAIFGPPEFHCTGKVNWVKEYTNPKAKDLYEKAMKTKDLQEKMKLFNQMGEYKLIDLEQETLFDNFIENIMNIGKK